MNGIDMKELERHWQIVGRFISNSAEIEYHINIAIELVSANDSFTDDIQKQSLDKRINYLKQSISLILLSYERFASKDIIEKAKGISKEVFENLDRVNAFNNKIKLYRDMIAHSPVVVTGKDRVEYKVIQSRRFKSDRKNVLKTDVLSKLNGEYGSTVIFYVVGVGAAINAFCLPLFGVRYVVRDILG